MDTISIHPPINDAAESIRRAKPKTFYIIKDRGYTDVLPAAKFKKLKTQLPIVQYVVEWGDKITPKLIAKLQDALVNPPYYEDDDGESYPRKAVEKAKAVTGIQFSYDDHTDAFLLSTGLLAIGCQRHKLGVWEKAVPDSSWDATVLQNNLASGINAAARDALIPVLKAKLKQLRGGAK